MCEECIAQYCNKKELHYIFIFSIVRFRIIADKTGDFPLGETRKSLTLPGRLFTY